MRRLSGYELAQLWDWGSEQHPLERALLLLETACSDEGLDREQLLDLPVGRRNARLLELRRSLLGETLESQAVCPGCEAELEISLDVEFLLDDGPSTDPGRVHTLEFEPAVRFRLPTTRDLLALTRVENLGRAQRLLLERCLEPGAPPATRAARLAELGPPGVAALGNAMEELDPQADQELNVECRECEHAWTVGFDVVGYLWAELEQQVRELGREVHRLASAYSWSDADILAMSRSRRQWFLDLVP